MTIAEIQYINLTTQQKYTLLDKYFHLLETFVINPSVNVEIGQFVRIRDAVYADLAANLFKWKRTAPEFQHYEDSFVEENTNALFMRDVKNIAKYTMIEYYFAHSEVLFPNGEVTVPVVFGLKQTGNSDEELLQHALNTARISYLRAIEHIFLFRYLQDTISAMGFGIHHTDARTESIRHANQQMYQGLSQHLIYCEAHYARICTVIGGDALQQWQKELAIRIAHSETCIDTRMDRMPTFFRIKDPSNDVQKAAIAAFKNGM